MTPILVAAAAAFNLVCSGTSFVGEGLAALKKENQTPYNQIFRIDLAAGRWCLGSCETTDSIYNINSTKIMLKYEHDDKLGSESFILLNREDGTILDRTKLEAFMIMNTGKCDPAPFSGFPARKF